VHLNFGWDIFFAIALCGKVFWYIAESPSSHGISKVRQFLFYLGMVLAFILLVGPVAHAAVDPVGVREEPRRVRVRLERLL
jgi:hypothetical protein